MKKNTKVIICITSIIIIVLVLLGFTYGYFYGNVKENTGGKTVNISSKDTSVNFTDLSEKETSDIIAPGYENIKLFTVQNVGNVSATFHIYLDDVVNTYERVQDIKYTLYRKAGNNTIDITDFSDCEIVSEGYFPKASSYIKTNEIIETKGDYYTYALKVTYINSTENQNIDQGKTFSSKVQIHGDIVNPFTEGTLAYEIFSNSVSGASGTIYSATPLTNPGEEATLFEYSKGIDPTTYPSKEYWEEGLYYVYASDYTVDEKTGKYKLVDPKAMQYSESIYSELKDKYTTSSVLFGFSAESKALEAANKEASIIYKIGTASADEVTFGAVVPNGISKENTLSLSTDNDGPTYYYRGLVKDNYVNFAGMCWRIVRINGDESIKLILEDQNTTCDNTAYTGEWNIGSSIYGWTGIDNYGKADYLNGELVGNFKEFQSTLEAKLTETYTNKNLENTLKGGNWCIDDLAYSDINGNTLITDMTPYYEQSLDFYYSGYTRLNTKKTASLLCGKAATDNFNDSTIMYVATLTVDEVAYAGSIATYNFQPNYLSDNGKTNSIISYKHWIDCGELWGTDYYNTLWWTLTPSHGNNYGMSYSMIDTVFYIYNDGGITNDSHPDACDTIDYTQLGSRPSINLIDGTTFKSGNGTQTSPYEIG